MNFKFKQENSLGKYKLSKQANNVCVVYVQSIQSMIMNE